MTFGSLFAGIGGMDLGLERAGMVCRWQVEIDEYCRRVLARHWPDVPKYGDVRDVGAHNLEPVDLICGGFPCQDISNAGKRAGINGERSGLWTEFARIVRELRPRYVLVENVAALLARGLDRVLGDLAESGYDAEWDCIPAAAVGAPHRRDRLFVIAYTERERSGTGAAGEGAARSVCDDDGHGSRAAAGWSDLKHRPARCGRSMADATQHGRGSRGPGRSDTGCSRQRVSVGPLSHPLFAGLERDERSIVALAEFGRSNTDPAGPGWWAAEPDVGRVAHGVPARVDRLKALGNAVVPQVAEYIGMLIVSHVERLTCSGEPPRDGAHNSNPTKG